ncbi:MAG: DUF2470 domain-containing protein [Candidatus Nanopelagicales bacterium]
MSWLTAEVIEAVSRHMNDDHADDTLTLARTQYPDAESARVTGLDHSALLVRAVLPDGSDLPVALPWPKPLTGRADIRTHIVHMHETALTGEL